VSKSIGDSVGAHVINLHVANLDRLQGGREAMQSMDGE